MTLVPHGLFFYDELPLWLVASTRREAMLLCVTSWLGWFGWIWTSEGPSKSDMGQWVILSLYIPALLVVLRRRNEGRVPGWVQRWVSRLPAWLRGTEPAGSAIVDNRDSNERDRARDRYTMEGRDA